MYFKSSRRVDLKYSQHSPPPPQPPSHTHTRKLYEGMDTLISLIVVIPSQGILDHQVVNLKYIYIYIISNCQLDFSKAESKKCERDLGSLFSYSGM